MEDISGSDDAEGCPVDGGAGGAAGCVGKSSTSGSEASAIGTPSSDWAANYSKLQN